VAGAPPPVSVQTYVSSSAFSLSSVMSNARRAELEESDAATDRREAEAAVQRRATREEEPRMIAEEEAAAERRRERRTTAAREEEEDRQQTERRRAAAARAARAADVRTAAACAAEAARRTRAVAIRQEQEAAQVQELEATLEVVRRDLEELGHAAQGAGHNVPPVDAAAQGCRPPPQEVPVGDGARQRAAEVHGWVPDSRRQDVERPRVERRSVHSFVHDSDSDYNHDHDDAPPMVVKTIIRDSSNTQWPVLMKTNYAEWSSMMKVKLEARRMWIAMCLGGVSCHEDRRPLEALCSAVATEMLPALSGKATTKDARDAIATARIGSDRVRKSTLQKLRLE
jgi:hypothetical protein